MRNSLSKLLAVGLLAAVVPSCSDDNSANPDARRSVDAHPGGSPDAAVIANVDVTADITSDTTWTSDKTYHLKVKAGDNKYIFVRNGATLTIEPGTHVLGADASALIIARGAKIQAVGTASNPIVFSHDRPVGQREPGKWGGVLVLGSANINIPGNNETFEALPAGVYGEDGKFGGANDDDNSGTIKYVRIEFAGFEYIPTREFNGLTLCGVGRGTTIEFVQVHRGSDDGVEFFGGSVNVKHMVLSQNEDDGFDTDNGYRGKAQFIVIQHINGKSSDPNGYESDNNAATGAVSDPTFSWTPTTHPTVYNATVIGNKGTASGPHFGALIRRGTSGMYRNQIIMNFHSAAVEIRDAKTAGYFPATLSIESSIFFENPGPGNWSATQADFDEMANLPTAAGNREIDPMLEDPSNATAPNFKPKAASPALTGGAPAPDGDAFIETVTYVGAIGDTDWTKTGWTDYPEN